MMICSLGRMRGPFLLAMVVGWMCLSVQARGQELRTWTDLTGKFSIKAKLIGVDGGKVNLEREDGTAMQIDLKKLSKADQEYISSAGDSPFQEAESPFKPSEGTMAREAAGGPKTVDVDWSSADLIALTAPNDTWQLTPPEFPALDFRPRNIALPPKANFFEGMKGLAINVQAQKAVVGYGMDEPRPDGTTRIVVCDLKTGKTTAKATAPGRMAPLAIHDDGQHILMRRNEFGFGNQDRLEIWSVRGSSVAKSLIWTPYDDAKGGDRDVMWGEFLDDQQLATSSRGGKVAIWNIADAQPICYFQLSGGAVPALSVDRKWMAFCSDKAVGVFDVAQREVVALTSTPHPLQWPYVAFSPTGKRIGCIAFDHVLVWDVATGELIRDIPCPGVNIHGAIAYPDDSYVLGANSILIDIESQLKLWQYSGMEQVNSVGGWTFAGVSAGDKPGALLALKIPHAAATKLLQKALREPDLFVFRAGTAVRLNVDGIEPSQRARVAEALANRLTEMKCSVVANGTIDLVAWVEGPKEREVSFTFSGDYKMKEYVTRVRFVYQGQAVWETSSTNVPGMLMLKQGENVEGALREREKPGYEFFSRVELPKFLQKPADGQGPTSRQTLGASKVTVNGIE